MSAPGFVVLKQVRGNDWQLLGEVPRKPGCDERQRDGVCTVMYSPLSMRIALLTVAVAALAAVPVALAKDRQLAGKCSESGDVCTQISVEGGVLFLNMSLAAKYFSNYKLCVTGPKSRVCKTFAVRAPAKAGDTYYSKVNWRRNFPYQGAGTYRVAWDSGPATLSFKLPLA